MPGSRRQLASRVPLVIPENRLAVSALKKLLASDSSRTPSQHLLTLIGPSGTGKSLLVRQALKNSPGSSTQKVVLVTASEFAAQYAEAVKTKSEKQFQLRYRKNIDVLVLEDIQILGGRPETQQQLRVTLDDVLSHGGSCILTSTSPAGEIPGLSKQLVNRLHGGVSVDVELPGEESKVQLCHYFATSVQLMLNDAGARMIAQASSTPADIVGLLTLIRQSWKGSKKVVVDDDFVHRFTNTQPQPEGTSIEKIATLVSREFQVPLQDLRGSSRSRLVLIPRQVAMFLAREVAQRNFDEIGKYFGNRNHNTTLYACRKIKSLLAEDTVLASTVHRIRKAAAGPSPAKSATR